MSNNNEITTISLDLLQSIKEDLEMHLESHVDAHCSMYICDGYTNMSPQERWKKWGLDSTYETWVAVTKLENQQ